MAFSITAYYYRLEFWVSVRIVYFKNQIKIQIKVWSRKFEMLKKEMLKIWKLNFNKDEFNQNVQNVL